MVRARSCSEASLAPWRSDTTLDPWGNFVQIVQYSDVQFTKTPEILEAMRLGGLTKSESALAELRAKGLLRD